MSAPPPGWRFVRPDEATSSSDRAFAGRYIRRTSGGAFWVGEQALAVNRAIEAPAGEDMDGDDDVATVAVHGSPRRESRSDIRARLWCFVENNPTDIVPFDFNDKSMGWLIYQKEKGAKGGVVHWQGAVYFKTARSLVSLKKLNRRAKWIPAKGSAEDNKVYCTKPETRIEGPWEFGVMPSQGASGRRRRTAAAGRGGGVGVLARAISYE